MENSVVSIQSEEQLADIIKDNTVVFIDFYKNNCQPCERMAELISKIDTKESVIAKVNCEDLPELAIEYGIAKTPTIFALINGAYAGRGEGYLAASKLLTERLS